MPKEITPDAITRKSIDLIIQNTRMNKIVWDSASDSIIKSENVELYLESGDKIFMDVEIHRFLTSSAFDTRPRYFIVIGDKKVTNEYTPVDLLGKYLFCEDYKRSYNRKK